MLLADDQQPYVHAARTLVEAHGFEVVDTVTSARQALARLKRSEVDVVVLNIALGTDTIRDIRARHPSTAVIALAKEWQEDEIAEVLSAGAGAYVRRSADPKDLVTAIRQAFDQSIFLGPSSGANRATRITGRGSQLTARELEILRLVSDGSTNAELARRLWVTEKTIKFHLSNIYRKLGVSNRTEASRYAQLHGLLRDGAASA